MERRHVVVAVLSGGPVAILGSLPMHGWSSGLWPLGYLVLATGCLLTVWGLTDVGDCRRLFWVFGPVIATLIVSIYGVTDRYTVKWSTVWDAEKFKDVPTREPIAVFVNEPDGPFAIYTDTYHRWSHRLVHRSLSCYPAKFESESDSPRLFRATYSRGPMARAGVLHGHWVTTCCDPSMVRHAWYWYGEEISEGEWHLQNR